MSRIVLGLDIGGANLKAATSGGRAKSVPFPLWKQPDRLAAALAELVREFPESGELAVTMTGELCDCFATKREGVAFILDALPKGMPAKVWSTEAKFVDVDEARTKPLAVAAANWHALATFAGRYAPVGDSLLIDIGSTTTDIIPLDCGVPVPSGLTDYDRLRTSELVYTGVKRTPVCAVYPEGTCAEFFAEIRDVNILLGLMPESETTDTADGRPASWENSLARLARMFGGDVETLSEDFLIHQATRLQARQAEQIAEAIRRVAIRTEVDLKSVIVSGSGEWLAEKAFEKAFPDHGAKRISLGETLGPMVSSCSPAYAVALLAQEAKQ
jgi:probable H4MPT-linked C1 transfer pathway protein